MRYLVCAVLHGHPPHGNVLGLKAESALDAARARHEAAVVATGLAGYFVIEAEPTTLLLAGVNSYNGEWIDVARL